MIIIPLLFLLFLIFLSSAIYSLLCILLSPHRHSHLWTFPLARCFYAYHAVYFAFGHLIFMTLMYSRSFKSIIKTSQSQNDMIFYNLNAKDFH